MKIQLQKFFPIMLLVVGFLIPGMQLSAAETASVEVILVGVALANV